MHDLTAARLIRRWQHARSAVPKAHRCKDNKLLDLVKRSVETSASVHVLTPCTYFLDVYTAFLVTLDTLPLSSTEARQAHHGHHGRIIFVGSVHCLALFALLGGYLRFLARASTWRLLGAHRCRTRTAWCIFRVSGGPFIVWASIPLMCRATRLCILVADTLPVLLLLPVSRRGRRFPPSIAVAAVVTSIPVVSPPVVAPVPTLSVVVSSRIVSAVWCSPMSSRGWAPRATLFRRIAVSVPLPVSVPVSLALVPLPAAVASSVVVARRHVC